jgi:hypothetical protein
VALGVVGRPELLFLDEPTTGFDPEARRQFWKLISGLSHDGTTIMLTTHYLDEAEALADRVVVIADGRIRAAGTPAELGGRDKATATVCWQAEGGRHSTRTDTPARVIAELAQRYGGETAILLAIGVAFLGLSLPDTATRWFTLAWLFVLSVAAFSLLGVAVSGIAGSGQSAAAVFQFPYLVLSFISGVYFVYGSLPRAVQDVAAVFPLKWLCQGLRSVFLPDSLLAVEPTHSWQRGQIALVLGAWVVVSLVVCVRTFRWQGRDEAR